MRVMLPAAIDRLIGTIPAISVQVMDRDAIDARISTGITDDENNDSKSFDERLRYDYGYGVRVETRVGTLVQG